MNKSAEQASPALAARMDWMSTGEFMPEQFQGEQRQQYEAEAARIEQQRDNQSE